MQRPRSYIGVTGYMRQSQVHEVTKGNEDVLHMVGLLVSSKTMRGETNNWPHRYPKVEDIGKVFIDSPSVLNLVHFNTRLVEQLPDELAMAQDLAGPFCQGFQLNIAWPDKRLLEAYRARAPAERNKIVLQCGSAALDAVGRDSNLLTERIAGYEGLIDYVLIDPSGGTGQDFDVDFAYECFAEFMQHLPGSIGMGAAGGLCADNVERLEPLAAAYSFSVDAEGKLQLPEGGLNVQAACDFVDAVAAIL